MGQERKKAGAAVLKIDDIISCPENRPEDVQFTISIPGPFSKQQQGSLQEKYFFRFSKSSYNKPLRELPEKVSLY
jgi:hypothetical protein